MHACITGHHLYRRRLLINSSRPSLSFLSDFDKVPLGKIDVSTSTRGFLPDKTRKLSIFYIQIVEGRYILTLLRKEIHESHKEAGVYLLRLAHSLTHSTAFFGLVG